MWNHCERSGLRGRTVTLKVKFANFQVITRSRTGQMQIRTRRELEQVGNALLEPLFPVARGIRLLGLSLSSLAEEQAEREPEFSLARLGSSILTQPASSLVPRSLTILPASSREHYRSYRHPRSPVAFDFRQEPALQRRCGKRPFHILKGQGAGFRDDGAQLSYARAETVIEVDEPALTRGGAC